MISNPADTTLMWGNKDEDREGRVSLRMDETAAEWTAVARLRLPGTAEIVRFASIDYLGDDIGVDDVVLSLDVSGQTAAFRSRLTGIGADGAYLLISPRLVAILSRFFRSSSGIIAAAIELSVSAPGPQGSETQMFALDFVPALGKLPAFTLVSPRARPEEAVSIRIPHSVENGIDGRIELCRLKPQFDADARFSEPAYRTVLIKLDAVDQSVDMLIGSNLKVQTGRGGQVGFAKRADGWWVPSHVDIVDLYEGSIQTVVLDVNGLQAALLQMIAAGQGPTTGEQSGGVAQVWQSFYLENENGKQPVYANLQIPFHFAWDLRETAVLDIPDSNRSVRLFDPQPEERNSIIGVPWERTSPRRLEEGAHHAESAGLDLPLRLVRFPPGTRIDIACFWKDKVRGGKSVRSALNSVTVGQSIGLSGSEQHMIQLPLDRILPRDTGLYGIIAEQMVLQFTRIDPAGQTVGEDDVELEIRIDNRRQESMLCIDWGASSISMGINVRNASTPREAGRFVVVKLGSVLRHVSQRAKLAAVSDDPSAPEYEHHDLVLDDISDEWIASQVSLHSGNSLREVYRPYSFGDLRGKRTSNKDAAAVFRRLAALGRRYDITMPPVGRLGQQKGNIIDSLKVQLANNTEEITLPEGVLKIGKGQVETYEPTVSVEELVRDCLDELRGFYLAEWVDMLKSSQNQEDVALGALVERALVNDHFRLVLTHPCGLGKKLVERYRRAGREMVQRMDRGPLRRLEQDIAVAAQEEKGGVLLVPEALAAAYYVCEQQLGRESGQDADGGSARQLLRAGPARLVSLDLGAGTLDVSIVDLDLTRADREWNVKCHYGISFGGRKLDALLTAVVDALLEELVKAAPMLRHDPGVLAAERPAGEMQQDHARMQRWFPRQLEKAKRELTDTIFKSGGDYVWAGDAMMAVKVGEFGGRSAEVPLFAEQSRFPEPGVICRLRLTGESEVRLASRSRTKSDGSLDAWLQLEMTNIFTPAALVEFQGLPRVYRALDELLVSTELISRDLAKASWAWLAQAEGARAPKRTTLAALTGRAALWPPIFSGFVELAREIGARIIPESDESGVRPMRARRMKLAVMEGAFALAQGRDLRQGEIPDAPLAFRLAPIGADRISASDFHYVEDCAEASGDGRVPIAGRRDLQLARVVPGIKHLDARYRDFLWLLYCDVWQRAVDLKPFGGRDGQPAVHFSLIRQGKAITEVVVRRQAGGHNETKPVNEDGSSFIKPLVLT